MHIYKQQYSLISFIEMSQSANDDNLQAGITAVKDDELKTEMILTTSRV